MLCVKLILFTMLILIFLYLYAITPGLSRRKKYKPFLKYLYAHRGVFSNKKGVPENSLPAFRSAIEKGYGIEIDIHITKDNKVVVFHDDTLLRMCSVNGYIKNMTYDELKGLTLFETNEHIPLLSEVLSLVDGRVPLLIEFKCYSKATRMCELVNEILRSYDGPYLIQSFNPLILKWYRGNRPDIVRGQLSGGIFNSKPENGFVINFIFSYLLFNFLSKPDFISYSYKELNNLSLRINQMLYKTTTFVWTIRNADDFNKYVRIFDGIIFDSFMPPSSQFCK